MEQKRDDIVISINQLNKSYGTHHVLKGINLEVYRGEIFGFIGPNGVGKSTTIDCLIGAKKYDSGEIIINGYDIVHDSYYAKRSFGYTASEPTTYEIMTGNEYIEFIADVYEMDENAFNGNRKLLLNKFGLSETDMNKRISAYSHGMKQKVSLIASLLYNPDVWILDEPTVGLDIIVFETLREMMVKFAENGGTIFMTSHNIELVAKICDRVAMIKDGIVANLIDLNDNPDYRYQLPRIFLDLYKEN